MNPFKLDINDTTRFLLPILFPTITYSELMSNYFEGAYVGILDDESYDDTMILKFKVDDPNLDIEELLDKIDDYDPTLYLQTQQNFVVFNITNLEEYSKFLLGQYSKFTEYSKERILDFWGEDKESLLYGILYKTHEGIDKLQELYSTSFNKKLLKNLDVAKSELWGIPDILSKELLIV